MSNKQIDTDSLLAVIGDFGGDNHEKEPEPVKESEMALPAHDMLKSSQSQPKRKREVVLSIDPRQCRRWTYYDRFPEWFSYEHCSDIISDFRNGKEQEIPGIVRALENDLDGYQYEVVFGGRRHFSALFVTNETDKVYHFKALVKNIDDQEAARLMDLENRKRKDISDFERCVSYRQQVGKTPGFTPIFTSYNDLMAAIEERDDSDSTLTKAALSQMIAAGEMNEVDELISLFEGRRMQIPWSLAYRLMKLWNSKDGEKKLIRDEIKLLPDNLEKLSPEAIIKRLLKVVELSRQENKPTEEEEYQVDGKVILKKKASSKGLQLNIPAWVINGEDADIDVLMATIKEIVVNG